MSKHLFTMAAGLIVLAGGTLSDAKACEPASRKPAAEEMVRFKRVTTVEWETSIERRREPYKREITLRDECGRAYRIEISGTREVEVAVRKPVAVERWAKVSPESPE